ncbi:YdjY domain-containing protein [Mucisphaera sp.]|uniref:YdjY domain-containing protein n=1 Tax=Mucisphaera sp. TaxID=2913024 RepID=UPI003D11546C
MHASKTLSLTCILLTGAYANLHADFTPLTDHIRIDREAAIVEFDAEVVFEQRQVTNDEGEVLYTFGEWLELLACTHNTREHESLLATHVKPSDLHAALLLLNLEPGQPATLTQTDAGEWTTTPPSGPDLTITLLTPPDPDNPDAQPTRTPAGRWIIHEPTSQTLEHTRWLFTGSRTIEHNGETLYLANLSGSLISLVNFRDDLIVRPTATTSADDQQAYQPNLPLIPPPGTPVRVRITPAQPAPAAGQPPALSEPPPTR